MRTPLWKKMCHLNIPEKVCIFAWRICMNAIPTMMNLNKRAVQTDAICPIYRKEVETVEHAILKCDLAKTVSSNWNDCPTRILECNCDISDLALAIISQGAQSDLEKLF